MYKIPSSLDFGYELVKWFLYNDPVSLLGFMAKRRFLWVFLVFFSWNPGVSSIFEFSGLLCSAVKFLLYECIIVKIDRSLCVASTEAKRSGKVDDIFAYQAFLA